MTEQAAPDQAPAPDSPLPEGLPEEGSDRESHAAPPELGYEEARDELMRIVQQLESGAAPLTDALALWERGEHLAAVCQRWLDGARGRIEAARPGRSAGGDRPGP